MPALTTRWARAIDRFDALFDGAVDGRVYVAFRLGFALLLLLRSADFTRRWLALDHHDWVTGFDFSWSVEASPYLTSPLVPGLVLGAGATWFVLRVRFALGLLLLIGIRSRWTAAALTLLNYSLLLADRYRYFHHLHVLYLGVAWLVLCPERPAAGPDQRPAWPLQLLRSLGLGIYLAAGSAKLSSAWWSGDTLSQLAHLHQVSGKIWTFAATRMSYGTLAKAIGATELALPLLLCTRRTRRVGVVIGLFFHGLISCVMAVSTFGVTMALLLAAFWPARRGVARGAAEEAVGLQVPYY